jgi:hypothetical protein
VLRLLTAAAMALAQVTIADQLDVVRGDGALYGRIDERGKLEFAFVLEAGARGAKVGVGEAGMEHDFRLASRKTFEQAEQRGWTEAAREREAEEMIGRAKAVAMRELTEIGADHANSGRGEELLGFRRAGPGVAEAFERLADRVDARIAGDAADHFEDARDDVGVLVRVEMSGRDAGAPDLFDLRAQFPFDVGLADAPGCRVSGEDGQRVRQATVRLRERRNFFCGRDAMATDQYEMAADTERPSGAREFNSVVEGRTVSHESGAGKDAVAMRADNSFVDAAREAEIVRVEDEMLRWTGHRRELRRNAR